MNPKFILCIDWETSGTEFSSFEDTFKKFQGISFGAIIADASTFEPIETLYREIIFDSSKYNWTIEAEKIHGISREHLSKFGITQEDAAIDLASLVLKYFGTEKVMVAGHNVEFDIHCTRQLLEQFNVMFRVFHVKLDTASTGFATLGEYKSNIVFDVLGDEKRIGAHNALQDALITLSVLKNIKQIFQIGMNSL